MSESSSGYIIGFEVYTGKAISSAADLANPMDKECSRTTTLVLLGLLEKFKLLNKVHSLYMGNYYSSPELYEERYFLEAHACGTVHTNRKRMLECIKKMNVKPLESAYLCNGPLLCLRWKGQKTKSNKKPLTLISTIHDAQELLTTKKDSHGNRLLKPQIIFEYTKNMSSVDLYDQHVAFQMSMRKSIKWWGKLFFHIMNMILLNAYILNTKFGNTKLSHEEYMDYIAKYLINASMEDCTCIPTRCVCPNTQNARLLERHFMHKIPKDPN